MERLSLIFTARRYAVVVSLSIRLPVRPSLSGIVPKRLNIR